MGLVDERKCPKCKRKIDLYWDSRLVWLPCKTVNDVWNLIQQGYYDDAISEFVRKYPDVYVKKCFMQAYGCPECGNLDNFLDITLIAYDRHKHECYSTHDDLDLFFRVQHDRVYVLTEDGKKVPPTEFLIEKEDDASIKSQKHTCVRCGMQMEEVEPGTDVKCPDCHKVMKLVSGGIIN